MIVDRYSARQLPWVLTQTLNLFKRIQPLLLRSGGEIYTEEKEISPGLNFRELFEDSQVAVFRSRLQDGLLLNGNKRAYEMLGIMPGSRVSVDEFYADQADRVKIACLLRKDKKLENYELKMTLRNGQSKWVSLSGKYDEDTDLFEGFAQEITNAKRVMDQLHEANFELDNFIYRASHDLRSPLLSIVGLVKLMETEEELKNIRQYSQYILKSINRLDNTIQDMMVLTKGERTEENIKEVNFQKLTKEVWQNLTHLKNHRNVKFQVKIRAEALCFGYEEYLKIILSALLSNAVQYSYGALKPTVRVEIFISLSKIEIEVIDNGDGIKSDIRANIYDMFYRGNERSEGAGLGLYTVKKLVTKLNGKISLETEYKRGSTFRIKLPNEGCPVPCMSAIPLQPHAL